MLDKIKNLFLSGANAFRGVNIKDRFDILDRAGQGSMSKVFKARDRKNRKTVCLKILDKEKTAQFEARFPGLKRPSEGEICSRMTHENVVATLEHGVTTDSEQYVVMEYLEGHGLNQLTESFPQRLKRRRVKYLVQLADGLAYIHERGFLHRDICPRNAIITASGSVKIIDLGLSIPYTPEFCRPGNRTGTANYLAPEVILRKTTDHRVDLFALGVTAYEVFTSQLPWDQVESSSKGIINRIHRPPIDPRDFRPDLQDEVVEFILKAIESDPAKRFQTALAFKEAIAPLAAMGH